MDAVFLKILNMSINASWLVIAVVILRLLLKKAPKWLTVVLWSFVAVRLICPFSFESVLSLIPSAETIPNSFSSVAPPSIQSGVTGGAIVNPILSNPISSTGDFVNPTQIIAYYASFIWLAGIAAMLLYTVISYVRISSKVKEATPLKENIWICDRVDTPFIFGVLRPRIYLPSNMKEQDAEYVIAHEKAHLKRYDHLWKLFGFLLLTVYWFNPILWVAYVLLCRDIELACDEKVIKDMGETTKKPYSAALINCSAVRKTIAACPLAFGEVGVKQRIKSVLNYKKPAFWIVAVSVIASIVTAVCFLTNPITHLNDQLSIFIDGQIAEHNRSKYKEGDFTVIDYEVLGVNKSLNKTTVYMWALYQEYSFDGKTIHEESGSHVPTVITARQTGSHGHYELVEYWTPRDGSLYAGDIKSKFPWYLREKAFDVQRYISSQQARCLNKAQEYFSNEGNVNTVDNSDASYTTAAYNIKAEYETTPSEQIDKKHDNGEFVITKPHFQTKDGTWHANGYSYKYRLEVSGKLHSSDKGSTWIVLSNTKDITFEQVWMASGLSSNTADYFKPEDAVIVGNRLN